MNYLCPLSSALVAKAMVEDPLCTCELLIVEKLLCICHRGLWYIPLLSLMITSSNGNIFRVTSPLCGEFTRHWWIPLTKASDTELWCFLGWVNNHKAGNLRRHCAHYDVTVTWNLSICVGIEIRRHSNRTTLNAFFNETFVQIQQIEIMCRLFWIYGYSRNPQKPMHVWIRFKF